MGFPFAKTVNDVLSCRDKQCQAPFWQIGAVACFPSRVPSASPSYPGRVVSQSVSPSASRSVLSQCYDRCCRSLVFAFVDSHSCHGRVAVGAPVVSMSIQSGLCLTGVLVEVLAVVESHSSPGGVGVPLVFRWCPGHSLSVLWKVVSCVHRDRHTDRQTDGLTDGWTGRSTDRQAKKQTETHRHTHACAHTNNM